MIQNPDRHFLKPIVVFLRHVTRVANSYSNTSSRDGACRALPWLLILLNFAEMAECNTVTVHWQPWHGQYLGECINIRELEVSLGTHPEF